MSDYSAMSPGERAQSNATFELAWSASRTLRQIREELKATRVAFDEAQRNSEATRPVLFAGEHGDLQVDVLSVVAIEGLAPTKKNKQRTRLLLRNGHAVVVVHWSTRQYRNLIASFKEKHQCQ